MALVLGLLYLLLPLVGDFTAYPRLPMRAYCDLLIIRQLAVSQFQPWAPPLVLLFIYTVCCQCAFPIGSVGGPMWWQPSLSSVFCCWSWQPLARFVSNTYDFCVLSVGQGVQRASFARRESHPL